MVAVRLATLVLLLGALAPRARAYNNGMAKKPP
jgi:hypothetical protein